MDWPTDFARTFPARWALIVMGLGACVADSGCAKMNSYLRGEPPLLGTTTPKTKDALALKNSNSAKRPGVTSPGSTDLYARSFGRTRPRAVNSPASKDEAESDGAGAGTDASANTAEPLPKPEEAVHTTAHSATETETETSGSVGVILKPPLPLGPMPRSTAHPATRVSRPVGPAEPAPGVAPTHDSAALVPGRETEKGQAREPTAESIVAEAQRRLDALTTYQALLNGQERVGDVLQEPENVLLSIRRNPMAVRLVWQEGPHKGREVLYSPRETNGMLRVNMADSPIPLPPLSLPPDSPLALRNSRHPISEAGFDTILRNLKKTIDENKAGDQSHGRIAYAGRVQAEQLDHLCHKISRVTGNGETWEIFFDPESLLPLMVQAHAHGGDLLERYYFRDIKTDPPELLADSAFDPVQVLGRSKGIRGRLSAGPSAGNPEPGATQ